MNINNILKELDILYLEDDEMVRKKNTTSISYMVKNIYSVTNAKEALDIYSENKPDIIITDIDMKGMNGLDFIKEIRKEDSFIPIIIISAYKTENFLMEALNLSIDKYIIKPVTLDILIENLEYSAKRIIELNRFEIRFENKSIYNLSSKMFTLTDGSKEILAKKEKLLFDILLENKNKLVTYFMIEEHVWNGENISKGNLKLMINKLRNIIGKETIVNEPQMGYKLIV